ncbi:MAG TPA: hypothetical protein VF177_02885 [Anaerolineae bacterium]
MRKATKVTVSTFGAIAAMAGIEHGIGEILQGNVAPNSIVIESWPGSGLFRILAGEPAMTIIPNLLVSGILAILFSLVFLVWALLFVQRKNGGLVLILLSIVMLLVGAGFGPPLLGIILGVTATRINSPLTWWRAHLSHDTRRFLSRLWPWALVAGFIAWLFVFPGSVLLDYFVGVANPERTIAPLIFSAFGLLLLSIATAFAHDLQQQTEAQQTLAMSR